jgi:hypothetical protein
MVAWSCEPLTKTVVRGLPFHSTTEEAETKFPPLRVSVNPAEPAGALVGEIELRTGLGLEIL